MSDAILAAPPRSRSARAVRALASHVWALLIVLAVIVFAWWAVGTRSQDHHIRAVFSNGVSLTPGLDVQVNGMDVGKISSVEYADGNAIVGLGIDDDSVWPIRQGTRAEIRFGTTAGNGTRRIDLHLAPESAPPLPENGILDEEHTVTPVEFDQVFNTMDARTRKRLQGMLGNTARTFRDHGEQMNAGFEEAAPGMETVAGLLKDLDADDAALSGLVLNTHRATRTLGARKAEISDLVSVSAATFSTFADNASAIQASLDEFPPTLADMRGTFARLDGTLGRLDALMTDVRPGARQLRPFAGEARAAVAQLRATAPVGVALLETGRAAAPDITALLEEGVPFAGRLAPVLSDLAPLVACVRPYAPEIAGTLSTWPSWSKNYDGVAHYARMRILGGPVSNTSTTGTNSAQLTGATGLKYAMPRPPGLNAGQPWLLPQCAVGEDALDPAKDPESR